MVSIIEVDKEESTSIYWSSQEVNVEAEVEDTGKNNAISDSSALEQERLDSTVVKKLRYLAEPFPRSAYRPLQFAVNGQLLTGGIASVTDSQIAIEVTEESKETHDIRTLDLDEIEEVFWKGSPFT